MSFFIRSAAFIAGLLLSCIVSAQTLPPEVQRGRDWLQAQVRSDGSVAGEDASIATPFQARTETLATLSLLGGAPDALKQSVAESSAQTTELSARRAQSLAYASAPDGAAAEELKGRQNGDGGFGGGIGFASNVLDTAFVLQAYAKLTNADTTSAGTALGYLGTAKTSDNGFGTNGQSDAYHAANVLLAAQPYSSRYNLATLMGLARDWLLGHRNASLHFGDTVFNASALLALSTQTSDPAVLQPLSDALKAAQAADGSWASDPYQTALALRALAYLTQAPPAPTTAEAFGKVVDAATGAGLGGVTVQSTLDANVATTTSADGTFALGGIAPGSVTLRLSKVAYERKEVTFTVAAGQRANLGNLQLRAAPLTATLSGVVRNSSGTLLADALVSVESASVVTNASGVYELAALSPGAATVTVTKSGYRTLSAQFNLQAGVRYVFSPTLYLTSQTPPASATLRGIVWDVAGNRAITGATVTLDGVTKTTLADGKFEFTNLTAGPFSIAIAKAGFQSLTATGSVVEGTNDIGKVNMIVTPTTSTLTGTVMDAQSKAAIPSATLTVQGQTATAVSGGDGKYSLTGIQGTSFVVTTTAAGYLSSSLNVTLGQTGTATLDVELVAIQASGIAFDEVRTDKPVYDPAEDMELEIEVRNTTDRTIELVIDAEMRDASGAVVHLFKANVQGLGQNPPNLPLAFQAGSLTEVEMDWVASRVPAGVYTILARGSDASGRVLTEGSTRFTINAGAALRGGVTPTPPIVQAGTETPVAIKADVTNAGNEALAPGAFDMTITLENPDTAVTNRTFVSPKALATGAPINSPRGIVRDGQGNLYVVNATGGNVIRITPQGVSSVYATLPNTNMVGLALDGSGHLYAATSGRDLHQISPQGVVTKIVLAEISNITGIDAAADGTLMIVGQQSAIGEHRLVRRAPGGTETVLWRNGLAAPIGIVPDGQNGFFVANFNDGTVSRITRAGEISPYASGLKNPRGLARDAAGNLYAANGGDGTIAKIDTQGVVTTYASGIALPVDIEVAADGSLFVSAFNANAIVRVRTDGTVETFARGIANSPEGMKYDAAGNLLIANGDGTLRRLSTSNVSTVVATGLTTPKGIEVDPAGNVFVAQLAGGSIAKVSGTERTTFASGLSSPYGIARGTGGSFYVTERDANRIAIYDAGGARTGTVDSSFVTPTEVLIDSTGRVFVLNSSFVSLIEAGQARVLARGLFSAIAIDHVNGGLVAFRGAEVSRIGLDGVVTKIKTLAFTPSGITVDASGRILMSDNGGRKIMALDAAGVVTTLVPATSLPNRPDQLVSDAAGNVFVRVSNSTVLRVAADGAVTPVVTAPAAGISVLGMGADGRLALRTSGSAVYAYDVATQTTTLVRSSFAPTYATFDATGRMLVSLASTHDVVHYDTVPTVELAHYYGFAAPQDIVAFGEEFRFVDNAGRVYRFVPGLPIQRYAAAVSFPAQYLANRAGALLGTYNSTVYSFNATGSQTVVRTVGAPTFGIAAGGPNGATAVGENSTSRVTIFNSSGVLNAFAGLNGPHGLALDASGSLYVANYNANTITRMGTNGEIVPFAATGTPRYLDIDASGNLWATAGSSLIRYNTATGAATTVGNGVTLSGLSTQGGEVHATDGSSQLLRSSGSGYVAVAAGLTTPNAIDIAPNGDVYIGNAGNWTIVRYDGSRMTKFASAVTNMRSIANAADGRLYIGHDNGVLTRTEPGGGWTDLRTAKVLGGVSLYALTVGANNKVYAGTYHDSIVYELTIQEPQAPPAPGTVVHSATLAAPAIPVSEDYTILDFGNWLPELAGDYKITVSRAGVPGTVTNFVHVGPHARGTLMAAQQVLQPGDQSLQMCLNLEGADFTSLSRAEVSQVRRVASIGTPRGMAADREGNIYFTDSSRVYKSSGGTTSTLASGLSIEFGLAADSNENLFFPARNASTGRYELRKIDKNGTLSTVANLNTTTASGVAVNSRDEILVGTNGRLLRVTQAGEVTTVGTRGIPQPRGITIDARDNVYVQNENHFVSMIKPDGTAFDIYSKADGYEEPIFEGDGYPNITADCADNVYIATSTWAKIGSQFGQEEHTLAQIVARTGHVGLMLDTAKVNSVINDIDYLAFDRFANRILMWNHYEAMIWQVPVTCGAIGVEAHLVTETGQSIVNASKMPSATVPLADGRTEYVWSLRDVTAQGESICFDTNLDDLQLGERRRTMNDAFIGFTNSFAPGTITQPVEIPYVDVGNLVDIAVTTDKAEYAASSTALVSTSLTSLDQSAVTGQLEVTVHDAQGTLVGRVTLEDAHIPALGTLTVEHPFAIGAIVPAEYTVKAELRRDGFVEARATTTFVVLPDQVDASVTTNVTTDKQQYAPSDRVGIRSRATSVSANVTLENLTVMVRVLDPADAVVFTHGHPISQLLPGAMRDFVVEQPLANAAPGTYRVVQDVVDSGNRVLASDETTYVVRSSTDDGFGLSGTLTAAPNEVASRSPVLLDGVARNDGNAPMTGVLLRLAVVDVQSEAVLQTWESTVDIDVGATATIARTWDTSGVFPGDYTAVLVAVVDGTERILDQDPIRVTAEPVRVSTAVATDRPQYDATDRVGIRSGATNDTLTVTIENARIVVSVLDAADATLFTHAHALDPWAPGVVVELDAEQVLARAAPGTYRVEQGVVDATGAVLATAQASYVVRSSADTGFGLDGVLLATPSTVEVGQPVALDGAATNGGNADMAGVALRITLVDAQQAVVQAWDATADIAMGASAPIARTWDTSGVPLGTYTAILSAVVNGNTLELDRDPVVVKEVSEVIDVDVTQGIGADGRVLVLVSCREPAGTVPPCATVRKDFLSAYLTALGVEHVVVTTEAEFKREFRSGAYDTYWISGGAEKLANTLAEEVREAVFRGDGLVVEGNHDSRNQILDDALGVRHTGQLPHQDHGVVVPAGVVFDAASFVGRGDALKYTLTTATAQAAFADSTATAAIATNRYGTGRSVAFGFDLVATLRAEPASAALRSLVDKALRHVVPATPADYVFGDVVTLTTTIENRGDAVELDVTMTLPAGLAVVGTTPDAQPDTAQGTLTWRVELGKDETKALDVVLRVAGDTTGTHVIETVVSRVKPAGLVVLDTLAFELRTVAQAAATATALDALRALAPTTQSERNARDNAIREVEQALALAGQGQFDTAIRDLLKARDRVAGIATVDVAAARRGIATLMRLVGHRWYAAQAQ